MGAAHRIVLLQVAGCLSVCVCSRWMPIAMDAQRQSGRGSEKGLFVAHDTAPTTMLAGMALWEKRCANKTPDSCMWLTVYAVMMYQALKKRGNA